ncbi:MAG TPA: iron-sulfur cluster assembly scaffold protein [Blastocatellia bacterium]|jgi:nitrogen fixation NifU-like protein|nr:iron-sulfur cluster assembly scaffold protein [Blastocatellia bacterium]
MYSKQVAEHIASPRNVGELESPSGVGDVTNEVCKDRIRLTVRAEGDMLSQAKVKAQGCPPTIAAASALTELITNRPISELQMLSRADIIHALGHLPPAKKHCAALALEALREALDDIERRAPHND